DARGRRARRLQRVLSAAAALAVFASTGWRRPVLAELGRACRRALFRSRALSHEAAFSAAAAAQDSPDRVFTALRFRRRGCARGLRDRTGLGPARGWSVPGVSSAVAGGAVAGQTARRARRRRR